MNSFRFMFSVAGLSGALLAGSVVSAEEAETAPPQVTTGANLGMARYYSGPSAEVGLFPGKITCVKVGEVRTAAGAKNCGKEGYIYVLSMEEGDMLHPLLAGTEEVFQQLESRKLDQERVVVHGNFYPSNGTLLADKILLEPPGEEAADQP